MANPTVVLVHGAFADVSGFRGLYDELLGEDLRVVAPPNPLRGLTGGDGEYLKAVVGEIDGPVLLVGHCYGGSVITAARTAGNVAGLVYISGFAPDEGENLADLQSKFPAPAAYRRPDLRTVRTSYGHCRRARELGVATVTVV
jgi:pimeloyl-ACP methyl ester carboxylesterase